MGALSADAVHDKFEWPLLFELGNRNAITGMREVAWECVRDTAVDSTLTMAPAVDFQELV